MLISLDKNLSLKLFLVLFLAVIIFGFFGFQAASAQADFGLSLVEDNPPEGQPAPAAIAPDQGNSLAEKTLYIRNFIFSFLASTTGLSSLFWILIRGGLAF